jgi:hypothetical protein
VTRAFPRLAYPHTLRHTAATRCERKRWGHGCTSSWGAREPGDDVDLRPFRIGGLLAVARSSRGSRAHADSRWMAGSRRVGPDAVQCATPEAFYRANLSRDRDSERNSKSARARSRRDCAAGYRDEYSRCAHPWGVVSRARSRRTSRNGPVDARSASCGHWGSDRLSRGTEKARRSSGARPRPGRGEQSSDHARGL